MSKDSYKDRSLSEQKLALLARLLQEEGVSQAPRLKRIPRDERVATLLCADGTVVVRSAGTRQRRIQHPRTPCIKGILTWRPSREPE